MPGWQLKYRFEILFHIFLEKWEIRNTRLFRRSHGAPSGKQI